MTDFWRFCMPETALFGLYVTVRVQENTRLPHSSPPICTLITPFEELDRAPTSDEILIDLCGPISITTGQSGQSGSDQTGGVALPQGGVGEQTHEPAVVELDHRTRVELLQPPGALFDRLGD